MDKRGSSPPRSVYGGPLGRLDAVTESFFQRRVGRPVLDLLRVGAKPERLAWSLALGAVIGLNPLLGSTTALALAAAMALGLNVVASQLANHLVYPLELALFPLFVKLGSLLFRTHALTLDRTALLHMVKDHPWQTTRLLWQWEWHALLVWAAFAALATPTLYAALCPLLRKALHRLHNEPIVEK